MKFPLGVGVLWAVCGGFALGVFLRSIIAIPEIIIFILGIGALAAIVLNASNAKKLRFALVVATALVSCGVGNFAHAKRDTSW
jgi:hypothetical protein